MIAPLYPFSKGEKHFDILFNHFQYKNMLGGRIEQCIIHRIFLVHIQKLDVFIYSQRTIE